MAAGLGRDIKIAELADARMVERFGERGVHAYAFPTRERMAAAREEELTELGFSRRKAEYVLGVLSDLHAGGAVR